MDGCAEGVMEAVELMLVVILMLVGAIFGTAWPHVQIRQTSEGSQ
jgi:hypothetical protein